MERPAACKPATAGNDIGLTRTQVPCVRDRRGRRRPCSQLTIVRVEIPTGARPTGYAYVHDVELDGDEDLHLGSRVEICDEGDGYVPATVDEITDDELGRRYRLHLGA